MIASCSVKLMEENENLRKELEKKILENATMQELIKNAKLNKSKIEYNEVMIQNASRTLYNSFSFSMYSLKKR